MKKRRQSANATLLCVKEKLAQAGNSKPADVLDETVAAIAEGRGYRWAGIYVTINRVGVCQASTGPAPATQQASSPAAVIGGVRSEVVVPIKLGARTLGLIVAETGKAAANQERVLLQRVARLVARYFTTARSKQLLRQTREKAKARSERKSKPPQSERSVTRKAAAGERNPR